MENPSLAPAYVYLYPIIAEAAQKHGYAAAIHGSLARDMDIILVPWVKKASNAQKVVDAVLKSVGGVLLQSAPNIHVVNKPHGRLCWTILLEGNAFIDLSVLPVIRKARDDNSHIEEGMKLFREYEEDVELQSEWDGGLYHLVWVPIDHVLESDKQALFELDWEYNEEEHRWETYQENDSRR